MKNPRNATLSEITLGRRVSNIGFFTSIGIAVATLIAFALVKPPISGPFCPGPCIEYPFTDILNRFPKDYLWMYPTMAMNLLFVLLFVSLHFYAPHVKRLYTFAGLAFAVIASCILFLNYFVQVSVIQPSLINGEIDGIALFTQYNPHGLFIVLEEAGYLIMSIAMFCLVPIFSKSSGMENSIRWIFIVNFILTTGGLVMITIIFGINREYIFEVVAIVVNWIALIAAGILLSMIFWRNRSEAN